MNLPASSIPAVINYRGISQPYEAQGFLYAKLGIARVICHRLDRERHYYRSKNGD